MNSKQIKSSFEIYKGAKFKNGNDAIIEIVRKDDDGYVLFKTHNGSIHDTTEESMRNILEHNNYVPIKSSLTRDEWEIIYNEGYDDFNKGYLLDINYYKNDVDKRDAYITGYNAAHRDAKEQADYERGYRITDDDDIWLPTIIESSRSIKSSRRINSRFYQSAISKYTLSEAAQYIAALFFDLRSIHFLTTGNEFYTYHKLAEDLYEQTEDYYDDLIETAIGYDSDISAMYVLPGDWDSVNTDGSFDSNGQVPQTLILDKLEKIYDVLESVKEYDSMVKSKIDAMLEYYDKEIYKLKQALK